MVLPSEADAQFFKKLKDQAQGAFEDEVSERTENAVRCAVNDKKCIDQTKAADTSGAAPQPAPTSPPTAPAPATAAGPESTAESGTSPSTAGKGVGLRKITLSVTNWTWKQDPALARVRDHFLLGNDLWSAATDKPVVENFAQSNDLRLVAGRPDLLLVEGNRAPEWGFAGHSHMWIMREGKAISVRQGASLVGPGLEICGTVQGCREEVIKVRESGGSGPFLSSDLRRVVYIEKGDLWRGDVDWLTLEIVNRKKVTDIGLIQGTPVHWYRNTLLQNAGLSPEKPILKIDLMTGGVEELATRDILDKPNFANPSGSRLCAASPKSAVLACYDVASGTVSEIPVAPYHEQSLFQLTPVWIDDNTLVAAFAGQAGSNPKSKSAMARPAKPAGLLRIDFRAGVAEVLFTGGILEGRFPEVISRLVVLPGGRHVALDLAGKAARATLHRKVRVAVGDGAVAELPGAELHGAWLDDDRYLHARASGGLSEIGTWVIAAGSGDSRKVCHLPASLGADAQERVLHFPERDAVYFHAGPSQLPYKSNLKEGKCQAITETPGAMLSALRTPPVDLRPGLAGDALWRAAGAP